MENVFSSEMACLDQYDGEFLLLKDMDKAHKPSYIRGYNDLHTIGAFTPITVENVASYIPTSRTHIVDELGFDRMNRDTAPVVAEQVIDDMVDSIKTQIQQLRIENKKEADISINSDIPTPIAPKGSYMEQVAKTQNVALQTKLDGKEVANSGVRR